MAGRAAVLYTHDPKDDPKRFVKGLREGLRNGATHWQRSFSQRHFRSGAKARYGYQPRTAGYNKRKRRRFGHAQPLVWTGESRRWARTRQAAPRIVKTAFGLQGRLAIKMPRYFYAYRKTRAASDKVDEFLTTAADEAAVLGEIVADAIDAELARPKRVRKRL